ncbi:MAG: FAD:protein FMN transferase, partial [Candidatus Omnitrophica bacterium]|nr:FAD:protein FMN transferase [Candidatus Omnitrophota bacterium]
PNRVYFKKPGMKLDLGGIAKGFAADEISKILKKNGVRNFYVAASGSIFASGKPPDKDAWYIGIQDPVKKDKNMGLVRLRDKGVSTSGNYERFVTIKGGRYSHIIDPRSGYPQKYVVSATIIAPTTIKADAFGSAMCVLGGERGAKLLNALNIGIEALIIEEREGKLRYFRTKGFEKHLA